MTVKTAKRVSFLAQALNLIGVDYVWGGKGLGGLDCSGAVTFALYMAHGPDWRRTHNADRLYRELEPTGEKEPGALVFYGKETGANHVMILLGPSGVCFGASGGDSKTTTVEIARMKRARVKAYDSFRYRSDVLGFRKLPLTD